MDVALISWTVRQDQPAEVMFEDYDESARYRPFQQVALAHSGGVVFRGWITERRTVLSGSDRTHVYTAKDGRWRMAGIATINSDGSAVVCVPPGNLRQALSGFLTAVGPHMQAMGVSPSVLAWPEGELWEPLRWEGTVDKALDNITGAIRAHGWHYYYDSAAQGLTWYRPGTNGSVSITDPAEVELGENIDSSIYQLYGIVPRWTAVADNLKIELVPAWSGAYESAWQFRWTAPYTPANLLAREEAKVFRQWAIPQLIPALPDSDPKVLVQERETDETCYAMGCDIDWVNQLVLTEAPCICSTVSPNNRGKANITGTGGARRAAHVWLVYSAGVFAPDHVISVRGGNAHSAYGLDAERLVVLPADNVAEAQRQLEGSCNVNVTGTITLYDDPPAGLRLGVLVSTNVGGASGNCAGWTYSFAEAKTVITLGNE